MTRSRETSVKTCWRTSKAGSIRSHSRVITPRQPRASTIPEKSASSTVDLTSSPSAPTSSTPTTAVDRLPSLLPDPWVPVEHAPPTEMCGSEPRLCSAHPSRCSAVATSAYVAPAGTTATRSSGSTSIGGFSPLVLINVPVVSATVEKEWAVPRARTRAEPLTTCCSSSTELGTTRSAAENCTFPLQLTLTAPASHGRPRQCRGRCHYPTLPSPCARPASRSRGGTTRPVTPSSAGPHLASDGMQLFVVVLATFLMCTGLLIGWSREKPIRQNPKDQEFRRRQGQDAA